VSQEEQLNITSFCFAKQSFALSDCESQNEQKSEPQGVL